MADLGPGTMPRGKYPESPAPAGSHALISRTPTPGGMLHANLGLPRPPPRNFQPPLPQQPPKQTQQRRPSRAVASRQRSRNSGGMRRLAAEIPDIFIPLSRNDVRNDDGGEILSHPLPWSSSRSRNPTQSKHSSVRHITPRAAGSAHDAEGWRGAEKFSRRVWRRIWRISAAVAGALSPSSLRTSRRAFRHSSRIMSPSSERVTGMSGCMGSVAGVWRNRGKACGMNTNDLILHEFAHKRAIFWELCP